MIDDITIFLPSYPDITSDNFNMDIFSKKEFYDNKLEKEEPLPTQPGTLLKAQTTISRFLSSRTPYDVLLLKMEMGTGKTCASVAAIEQVKSEDSTFTGAVIIARGDTLLENYQDEIMLTCTKGQYIPDNYHLLTPGEQIARKHKSLKQYYSFYTFEIFVTNIISKSSDKDLIKQYSNKIIVIDEIHNIRQQDIINKKENKVILYDSFHRFLHIVKNCKILLLSGTPMKDTIDEIASIMNLILPIDKQMPTGRDFISEFFTQNRDSGLYTIKSDKITEIKSNFKGRISYLDATHSDIKKEFIGKKMGQLKHFKVYEDNMSEFQTKSYIEAYEKDNKREDVDEEVEEEIEFVYESSSDEREDEVEFVYESDGAGGDDSNDIGRFSTNSRQASLFVFPDGSYGKKGFEKYIKAKTSTDITTKKKIFTFTIGDELKRELSGSTDEDKLKKIEKYSSKFAVTIREILNAYKEGKSTFVYCEYVSGSGCLLFSLLLNLFNFSRYDGKLELKENIKPLKRYAIINNLTVTAKQLANIKDRFNNSNNKEGKIISLIIGSKVISEGFSLKNVQKVHILTPHWNYSETAQAIARGYRFGSHSALIKAGITPTFEIYQHVSVPNVDSYPSIDLRLYEISEVKDINIKGVEQLMKESAFDCALNYKRNHIEGYDNERECNYGSCEYNCDGIDPRYTVGNEKPSLDYSSYQVYYNSKAVNELVEKIKNIFKYRFSINLEDIITLFSDYISFDIVTSLRKIINDNIVIYNKYGIQSFLREENNIFFLADSISNQNNYFSNYYNEYPILSLDIYYPDIINQIYFKESPKIIHRIFESVNKDEINDILSSLKEELQEIILETCFVSKELNLNIKEMQRNIILEYFKNYLELINGIHISSLLYMYKGIIRYYDPIRKSWYDGEDEVMETYIKYKKEKLFSLKQNEYFGTYNDKNFCIIKSNFDEDKRKENKGKVCTSWDKPILIYLITDILNVPFVNSNIKFEKFNKDFNKKGKDFVIKTILESKYLKICISKEDDGKITWKQDDYTREMLNMYDDEKLKQMLYYTKLTKDELCTIIKEWFKSKGILEEDPSCGKRR